LGLDFFHSRMLCISFYTYMILERVQVRGWLLEKRTLFTVNGLAERLHASFLIIRSLGYPDIPSNPTVCTPLQCLHGPVGPISPAEERICIMARHGEASVGLGKVGMGVRNVLR
jgi:hypothetical protein